MKRKCAIGFMVLTVSIFAGVSVSRSAISNIAPDEPADKAPAGSPTTSSSLEEPPATVVQVTAPLPAPAAPAAERAASANPLWAMPLSQFLVTRERPIFSPSRRPPPPAVAPVTVPKTVAVTKKEPERPQLSLVGTIASDEEGFGIFLDQSSKAVIRLKVGEEFHGWKLRSVQGRETALEKDQEIVTLVLPRPGLGSPPPTEARNEVGPPGSDNRRRGFDPSRPRPDR